MRCNYLSVSWPNLLYQLITVFIFFQSICDTELKWEGLPCVAIVQSLLIVFTWFLSPCHTAWGLSWAEGLQWKYMFRVTKMERFIEPFINMPEVVFTSNSLSSQTTVNSWLVRFNFCNEKVTKIKFYSCFCCCFKRFPQDAFEHGGFWHVDSLELPLL